MQLVTAYKSDYQLVLQICISVQNFIGTSLFILELPSISLWTVRRKFWINKIPISFSISLSLWGLFQNYLHLLFPQTLISVSTFLCSYKSLDVKNILLETVSHHILPQMLSSPLWPDLNDLLSDYLRFMDDHFRESADLTFLAYRHRNYSKVSRRILIVYHYTN